MAFIWELPGIDKRYQKPMMQPFYSFVADLTQYPLFPFTVGTSVCNMVTIEQRFFDLNGQWVSEQQCSSEMAQLELERKWTSMR